MSEEQQRRFEVGTGQGAWGAVFCWTGIYLLRLLIGLVLGALLGGISFAVSTLFPIDYEYSWGIVTVLSVLVLTIALVTFLPLWRGLEKVNIRGISNTVEATRKLLVPAILLQLVVPLRGEIGLGIVNFFVAVGVCYLVTLARDFDRRSQFVLLLIAGGLGFYAAQNEDIGKQIQIFVENLLESFGGDMSGLEDIRLEEEALMRRMNQVENKWRLVCAKYGVVMAEPTSPQNPGM